MTRWGKVRIANVGDKIRARYAINEVLEKSTDTWRLFCSCTCGPFLTSESLIYLWFQYTLMVANNHRGRDPHRVRQIFYGRLEAIYDLCFLPHADLTSSNPLGFYWPWSHPARLEARTPHVKLRHTTTTRHLLLLTSVWWNVSWGESSVETSGESSIAAGDLARTVFVEPEEDDD
jgi:hypothetical protein